MKLRDIPAQEAIERLTAMVEADGRDLQTLTSDERLAYIKRLRAELAAEPEREVAAPPDRGLAVLRAIRDAEATRPGRFPTLHALRDDYMPDTTTARLAQVTLGLIRDGLAETNGGDPFRAAFRLTSKGRAYLTAQED